MGIKPQREMEQALERSIERTRRVVDAVKADKERRAQSEPESLWRPPEGLPGPASPLGKP